MRTSRIAAMDGNLSALTRRVVFAMLLFAIFISVDHVHLATGADEEVVAPYRMVVLLEVKFPDTRGNCTGFVVGPHTVATAGHCLYSPQDGGWATSVSVTPGVDGVIAPFARQTATVFAVSSQFLATGNPSFDYGAITMPSDVLGSAVGQFGIGAESDMRLASGRFETAGYPSNVTWGTQWHMRNPRALRGFDNALLVYNWGTVPGMSGAPIFEPAAEGYRALGIVTAGANIGGDRIEVGVRADTRMVDFYRAAIVRPAAAAADVPVQVAFTTAPGRPVLLQSTCTPVPGTPIILQSSSDRVRWTTIASGTTDPSGAGAFTIAPTQTMYYRLVAYGVGPGPVSQGVVHNAEPVEDGAVVAEAEQGIASALGTP